MDNEALKAIEIGREGLSQIISDPYFKSLVKRFPLNDEVRNRVACMSFYDKNPYFLLKEDNGMTVHPSKELGRYHLSKVCNDVYFKWFLLLYCITSGSELFRYEIYHYLDKAIADALPLGDEVPNRYFDLHHVPSEKRYNLVDGILDVDDIINQSFSDLDKADYDFRRYYICMRQAVSQFILAGGYHYIFDPDIVPVKLRERGVSLPISLSVARYITIMNGTNLYDSLRQVLHEKGEDGKLDDILAMVEKNVAKRQLEDNNVELRARIDENDQEIKKLEADGEIIALYFGTECSRDVIEERVSKCNAPEYRDLVHELESLTGGKLSVLTRIADTNLSRTEIEQFAMHHGVTFSDMEYRNAVTVEDIVDTVLLHLGFIEGFKKAIFHDGPLDNVCEGDPYSLETRIKEVETVFAMDVDRDKVSSLEELRDYVSENTIMEDVIETFVEQLGIERDEVKPGSSLSNDLGADSLDFLDLIMTAEHRYGIKIPDEELYSIVTVEDVYYAVLRQLGKQGQAVFRKLWIQGQEYSRDTTI